MRAYSVKFNHLEDGADQPEEMFLCLHATSKGRAAEKFFQMLGGVGMNNTLVSITSDNGLETFYDRSTGRFFTIPS